MEWKAAKEHFTAAESARPVPSEQIHLMNQIFWWIKNIQCYHQHRPNPKQTTLM